MEQTGRFSGALVGSVCALIVVALLASYGHLLMPPFDQGVSSASVPARWKTDQMPLMEGLHHSDPEMREAAASTLALRGPGAIPFIPDLIAALEDDHENVRYQAALTLGAIGVNAKSAIPALISHLRNRKEKDRTSFAQALSAMGPEAKDAVPALVAALEANDVALSRSVLKALAAIGPAANPAIPALIGALDETNAIESMGPEARAAVPELISLAFDIRKDYDVRDDEIRYEAVRALGKIGPGAQAAVPMLTEVIADRKHPLFYEAIRCLGDIGPEAEVAVPALTAIALDISPGNIARQSAAEVVFGIAPFFAEQLNLESALYGVYLEKIPSIKIGMRPGLSEEQKLLIKSLIAKLSETETYDDLGHSSFQRFAPLSDYYNRLERSLFPGIGSFRRRDQSKKPSDTFRRLVELGPYSLPFLLEALEDDSPTKLPPTGAMAYSGRRMIRGQLDHNPINPFESSAALSKPQQRSPEPPVINPFRIKVGDLCLIAIMQIVGRDYSSSDHELTASITESSSIASRELREKVRAIWASENTASRLLDSLLVDFATQAMTDNGVRQVGWVQTEAAMRLLYYFPRESCPLIAARLQSLDVVLPKYRENWVSSGEINGVNAYAFIRAVNWCKEPAIQKAMDDIADRTNVPEIKRLLALP